MKKVLMLIVIILYGISLFGCNSVKEREGLIPFNEGFLGGQSVDLNVVCMQAVVRSRQELITFFDGYNFVWIDNMPVWERYNNEFFETKAILLYIEVTASASVSYILEDVQMMNGALTLHIVGQYYGDTMDDVHGFASFVIEVSKSDINNITAFETEVKYEKLGD